uniref:Putative ovule protein n=1 Tax=Solanum chacoense TaxID=4108 RepID=A0A0V0GZN5_SOLCH
MLVLFIYLFLSLVLIILIESSYDELIIVRIFFYLFIYYFGYVFTLKKIFNLIRRVCCCFEFIYY